PYPPCATSIRDLNIIDLPDLQKQIHRRGKALVAKSVGWKQLAGIRAEKIGLADEIPGDPRSLEMTLLDSTSFDGSAFQKDLALQIDDDAAASGLERV
ncbi:hypothetical protein LTR35_018409, partial [Friedmanniomyces endolithicus]